MLLYTIMILWTFIMNNYEMYGLLLWTVWTIIMDYELLWTIIMYCVDY